MSNVRIFTRINKSRQVTPSLPLSSEEQLPVINPNPTGQAIRHNSTLDKNGGDSDNDYYGHNTQDIQEALEGSNLPSVINVFATIEDFNDYVTLNTDQEITGKKIFNADLIVGDPSLDYLIWDNLSKTFGVFSQAQFIHKYRDGAAGALNIGQFDVDGNASINNTSNAGISIGTNNIERIGIEANGDVLLKKVDNGLGDFVRINASTGKLTKRTVAEVQEEVGGGGGVLFTARSASNANPWSAITYGNGVFVAVATGGTNQAMTSQDGFNWIGRTTPAGAWSSVTFGNNLFVAVANSGVADKIMTSPDGITWTIRTTPNTHIGQKITFGKGLFVMTTSTGASRIMTSPDGITWTTRTSTGTIISITYGNGIFVAGAFASASIYTSSDGITWVTRTGLTGDWNSITYGQGLFVAVSSDSTNSLMTSPDGVTWTSRTATAGNAWYSVTYGNGKFVAVSLNGTNRVMISSDGITWTSGSASEANQWFGVTYGNGVFVAVSQDGTNRVMTSGFIIDPDVYRLNN